MTGRSKPRWIGVDLNRYLNARTWTNQAGDGGLGDRFFFFPDVSRYRWLVVHQWPSLLWAPPLAPMRGGNAAVACAELWLTPHAFTQSLGGASLRLGRPLGSAEISGSYILFVKKSFVFGDFFF